MVKRFFSQSAFLLSFALLLSSGVAAESEVKSAPGLSRIQLIADVDSVAPGEDFTVGLVLTPEPGFHTYWRGPGVVGVATVIEWTLPEGFEAGSIEWPLPEKVDMVGITANGYRDEVWLLTRIRSPEKLEGREIKLQAKAGWMACATSCHPGVELLSLTLPINRTRKPSPGSEKIRDRFRDIRESRPVPAPASWEITPRLAAPNRIDLDCLIPELKDQELPGIEFYSDDMQVNSDEAITVSWLDRSTGRIRLSFVRPDFAPKSPRHFAGLLRFASPLPGHDSEWVEIKTPWPEGSFPDE